MWKLSGDLKVGKIGLRNFLSIALAGLASVAIANPVLDDFAANGYINAAVQAIAPDVSGRLLIGGGFTVINGENRGRLARLTPDGSLDGIDYYLNGEVTCFVVQPDGKVVVGGGFTAINGIAHRRLARLNVDGTVDKAFVPNLNGTVDAVALDANDRILIGGYFTSVNGVYTGFLARLNSDGTLDSSFEGSQGGAPNGIVESINVRTDGKILIAGGFYRVAGVVRDGVALLEPQGVLNAAFYPNVSGAVGGATMYEDGRLILYGTFLSVNGVHRDGVARLSADGSLDSTFNPNPNGDVVGATISKNGKILIFGSFTFVAKDVSSRAIGRRRIARYLSEGALDETFDLGAEDRPLALAYQTSDHLLIGGYFVEFGHQWRSKLARLYEPINTTSSLLIRGSSISWNRGPEAAAVAAVPTLSVSVAGGAFTYVGRFAWENGAWRIRNVPRVSGPYKYMLAARVASGARNGSSSVAGELSPEYLFRDDFER